MKHTASNAPIYREEMFRLVRKYGFNRVMRHIKIIIPAYHKRVEQKF